MGLKIAVIGLSKTTHDQAPWNDPTWEKWGLPWDEGYWARCDRLFEMHDIRLLKNAKCRKSDYIERLKDLDVPLFMQYAYQEIPNAMGYPFGDVSRVTGNVWNSSIAYMLAMAIFEHPDEIGIWGVDMLADDEYAYQRPNCEYLVGLARGMGIKVTIPEESPLCKFIADGIGFCDEMPVYYGRYGWLG